jgi:hypothetical protein
MAGSTEAHSSVKPDAEVYPLGKSRPPLAVDDLPEPEEVFKVSRLGPRQVIQFVIGPSLIALGISIGSGEWLLGPQAVGSFGFIGIGWVITVSAILQTFYNVEVSRYVVATGEVPIVGWGRVPPGWKFWIPFSLIVFYFAFIFGGWAASAGHGLFALIIGRVHEPDELEYTRLLAIGLLFVVFLITVLARKISRALELSNWVMVGLLLAVLIVVDIAIVPPSVWWDGIRGLLTPAAPPAGITATTLGALTGFTALASGLNWYAMAHYRDHGYGMGHRVGFIAGVRGERRELLDVGVTFRDTPENASRWKRWYRLLLIDQCAVFFCGAMLGMLLPTILMAHVVATTGEKPTTGNVPTFAAEKLGDQYGSGVFYVMLVVGVLILFSTQLGIFGARAQLHRRRARDEPAVAWTARGRSAQVLLPIHVGRARGHRPGDPPDHAGAAGAVLGEHVEPRCPDVPVHVDVPELEAAQTGPTTVVALRDPGAELPVLRVLLRELRLRVDQR